MAGSNPTLVCTVARCRLLSLWAMGERLVHCWNRRGSNLRCSIFNDNGTIHCCKTILCFEAHVVLLHALWGAGFRRHHDFFKIFEKN